MISLLLWLLSLTAPKAEVYRDGKEFTVIASVDIERCSSEVWPLLWEFKHIKEYVDNLKSIDSLGGGDNWYSVRYIGDFPFLHAEVTNYKWIVEEGVKIGASTTKYIIESPLPIKFESSKCLWRLESLAPDLTRVHFCSNVVVDAGGFEGIYTAIAKTDGKRILRNFARYCEGY
ncbi:hypothetical protein GF359_06825 [candidate division WOR-3 bacterium]|uniref:SRPBCC family protein n=1 Tax=candidate division WOR-3 bacterium TaxID=2052148 RepID=A0A9D5KBX4_UNCW3|nr:hypothetical protein [candidate division WOR-3 bacterium]MBD3364911.1 hypothetical protein [candidate division WOR-3 bacterium]